MKLAVQRRGIGYPVLCLHGHPGSSESMSLFTENLSKKFQTIAPDLRGYGRSQTRDNFSMVDHISDLKHLLDRLKISQCLVLGWSLGGILAMELAIDQPERVSGLVLIATAACPRSDHSSITWQDNLFTGIASVFNRLQPGCRWNIEMFGSRSLYRYLLCQHTSYAYRRLAHEGMNAYLQTSSAAKRALNSALQTQYNRLSELDQIRCSCLVLAGEADRHITAASSSETARKLLNSDWRCYPNAAHLFPWEIPNQVMEDIDRWILAHPEAVGRER